MKTRVDIRLASEQKDFFEYAKALAGFKTLTEFLIYSVQQQANLIIEKHNSILASKKDQELFFDAIMNPAKPNEKLKKAAQYYNKTVTKK